ncbi:MAG: EamA family transporter [Candidatus Nanohaloarchaea archaeon]|nr:EamA family transporter [Candidatus Nanohaloarchaea archaeon]
MAITWFMLAISAAVVYSASAMFIKRAADALDTMKTLMYLFFFGSIFFGIYLLITGQFLIPTYAQLGTAVGAAVLSFMGNFFHVKAYTETPNIGFVDALVQFRTVFVTLLAWLIFGGEISLQGMVGILMVLAGAVILSQEKQGGEE